MALRDDAETQVVDAVEWFAWRTSSVQRQRRNGGVVIPVGLGKAPDSASENSPEDRKVLPLLASP
jgi:hypothetical protein